jgi:phenylacetate-CoA ligase
VTGDAPTEREGWFDARQDDPGRSALARAATTARLPLLVIAQRRLARLPPQRLRELQADRVRAIVRHAYESVPFYADAMRERGMHPDDFRDGGDLSRLPLIGPSDVRADTERFTSSRIPRETCASSYSSGTAGKRRGLIFRDQAAVLDSLAKGERDRAVITRLAGERYWLTTLRELGGRGSLGRAWLRLLDPRRDHGRISIYMLPHSASGERIRWNQRTLVPTGGAHHVHLRADTPLDEVARRFDQVRPRIAYSFGSFADRFLRFAAAAPEPIALPRVWHFISDPVSADGWRVASELGVRLWSCYSAVETGRLGFQCEIGDGHHLYLDSCAFRVVGRDGEELPPGEAGELIVSNLINRATVILNYRIGDRGAMATAPCRCGRTMPLLAEMQGRTVDVVRLADGRELPSLVFDAMFRWELRRALSSHVTELEPGRLRWTVVPVPGADAESLRRELSGRAAERAPGTEIDLVLTAEAPQTAAGKAPPARPQPD